MTTISHSRHALCLRSYLDGLHSMLARLPLKEVERLIDLLITANAEGRTIFVFGNGGSAATASHLACDLAKGTILLGARRFRVVSLTDNVPLITTP